MSENMDLLKTCENTSPLDRNVFFDVALYRCETDYLVAVEQPLGYGEKRFKWYDSALRYYAAKAHEAIAFDFSPYDGRA